MAINYLIHRILLAVFLLTGIDPFAVFAAAGDLADDRAIILGVLDNDAQADSVAIVFTETDIIPLGAGGNVIALRGSNPGELFYRFKVTETSLIEILLEAGVMDGFRGGKSVPSLAILDSPSV